MSRKQTKTTRTFFSNKESLYLIERFLFAGFLLLLLAKCLLLFFQNIQLPLLTSDSWGYFDISQNLFTDFYKVHYIRQYEYVSEYSLSFPPLYPFFIAVFNAVAHQGVYAGYYLNFFFFLCTLFVLTRISKKLTNSSLPALYLGVLLISEVDYMRELLGAKSIVLGLLLLTSIVLLFLQEELTRGRVILMGFLAGLLALARFDFLLPVLLLGGVVSFQARFPKLKAFIFYIVPVLLMLSPWIVFSYIHFGTLFATDNKQAILLAVKTFTSDYYPNSPPLPSLFNHPLQWLIYRVFLKGGLSFTVFLKSIYDNPFIQQLLGVNIFMGTVFLVIKTHVKKLAFPKEKMQLLKKFAWLMGIMLLQLFMISLPGYLDMRYALPITLMTACGLLLSLYVLAEQLLARKYVLFLSTIVLAMVVVKQIIFPLRSDVLAASELSPHPRSEHLQLSTDLQQMKEVMNAQTSEVRLLVDARDYKQLNAVQFAALSHLKTFETPANVNEYTLTQLVRNYQITHVYTTCSQWRMALEKFFVVTPTSISDLYAISSSPSQDMNQVPPSYEPDQRYVTCEVSVDK